MFPQFDSEVCIMEIISRDKYISRTELHVFVPLGP